MTPLHRRPSQRNQCSPVPSPYVDRDPPGSRQEAHTPEAAAERQRLVNELLGISEPQPRGRWRRRFL
jgi:hypothetical protein